MHEDARRIVAVHEGVRKSIFPEQSDKMAPRPSKRMSANDIEKASPTPLRGELPVSPAYSQESRNHHKLNSDFKREYLRSGAAFWPMNRVVEAICPAPEPIAPGVLLLRLFADIFIRPQRIPGPGGEEWTESVQLVARTVLQPATHIQGSNFRFPEVDDGVLFPRHFMWNVFWFPREDLQVTVEAFDESPKSPFKTLLHETTWHAESSGSFSFPFAMRRGAEDDTVIIRKGTPIARVHIT